METIAPSSYAKAAFLHFNISPPKCKNLNDFTPNPPIQIRLPLQRPEYRPPTPIGIQLPPRKQEPKPVTTTSDILHLMDSLKLPIPLGIYTSLIKECTNLGDPLKAIELYQHMRRNGVRLSLPLLNRILLMYVSNGCFEHARQLFDQMPRRDLSSCAVAIAGCVENGEHTEAMALFIEMLCKGELGSAWDSQTGFLVPGILVCVLKACLYTMDFKLGTQMHGWLWKMGYSRSVTLSSFLINFYGKMKCFDGAQSVFEQIGCRNAVVWTSRIVNFCSVDDFEGAVGVFMEMGREGVRKNAYTFSTVLKACGKLRDTGCGRQVHANVMKLGLETDGFVQCALVDFYGKCGFLSDATKIFEIGRNKSSSACWNAMLTNYMQHGLCIEALKILYEMKMAGFEPCESMFNEVRLICGSRVPQTDMDAMYL